MAEESITVTDNRTGKQYTIPIKDGAIHAADINKIKTGPDDFGLMPYAPAFVWTASTKSKVAFIDGDKGILEYRGYPIQDLAEKSTFLETAWLLLKGELPKKDELAKFTDEVTHHTFVHENVKKLLDGFHHDAHPMGILVSTVAALSTFYPDAKNIHDPEVRWSQSVRLLAKMPTIAAWAYRHSLGLPYVHPDNELNYVQNFLHMMYRMTEQRYKPHPAIERAFDVLFILHADHEQNCSANAMRGIGSSHADPYVTMAGAAAALYGPLHGGANEEVLKMLAEIGHVDRVPRFIEKVRNKEALLMGFGHRVYKNYDPRAAILKKHCEEVIKRVGMSSRLLEIAMKLEEIALHDDYFVSRKLYPNVDFYSGVIYKALGIPVNMFTVMFAMGRMPGWIAQ
ncbi:MAG: citrate synthase, partial [Planctomycetaceae bacterium]|nr:citrate synthase [Planctomycetaceae bacterium]